MPASTTTRPSVRSTNHRYSSDLARLGLPSAILGSLYKDPPPSPKAEWQGRLLPMQCWVVYRHSTPDSRIHHQPPQDEALCLFWNLLLRPAATMLQSQRATGVLGVLLFLGFLGLMFGILQAPDAPAPDAKPLRTLVQAFEHSQEAAFVHQL
jgi:hypothetical protein